VATDRFRYSYRTFPLWIPCFVFVGRPRHKILGRQIIIAAVLRQPPFARMSHLDVERTALRGNDKATVLQVI
jgi:hypothetical protein